MIAALTFPLYSALRTTADPKLASSYDSWVSYPFTISH